MTRQTRKPPPEPLLKIEWPGRPELPALANTRSITAEELERVVARDFSEARFSSLCNALAMSTHGPVPSSLLAFSEHALAREGGLDPDWQIELLADGEHRLPLLRTGFNVFECRRVSPDNEQAERALPELLARTQGAVQANARRTGLVPDRYTLFTNLRLGPALGSLRRQLERNLLLGHDRSWNADIRVVGAEELSGHVNRFPYLRTAFFEDQGLEIWRHTRHEQSRAGLFGIQAPFTGREIELAELRHQLGDRSNRIITLSGPAGIGKTRLALEATAHWQRETVIASSARLRIPGALSRLATPDKDVLVVIDNCDPGQARFLLRTLSIPDRVRLLVLITDVEPMPAPFLEPWAQASNLWLGPMSGSQLRLLLRRVAPFPDPDTENWYLSQAAGNPGLALAATRLNVRRRRETPSLRTGVMLAMKQRIREEFGDSGFRALRLLSLLRHVDASDNDPREVKAACGLMDEALEPKAVLDALPGFYAAGLVNRVGSLAEVVPVSLADELAMDFMRENPERTTWLVQALGPTGNLRVAVRPCDAVREPPEESPIPPRRLNEPVPHRVR